MSGLDGLGWPNPEDEPKPKKTMNSQLEIKLAPTPESKTMNNTPTPRTDAAWSCFSGYTEPLQEVKDLSRELERERDILKEHISIMDISHKTANDEYFELAAENEKLERERDEWKAKYIQQNKDLGCEMMDPNGTIWDYAKWVQSELTVVTKQRDQLEGKLCFELGGHPDSKLWGETGLIAATMRCVDALDAVTEQRDRLAAAVNAATVLIAAKGRHNTLLAYEGLRSALSPENANCPSVGATEKANDN